MLLSARALCLCPLTTTYHKGSNPCLLPVTKMAFCLILGIAYLTREPSSPCSCLAITWLFSPQLGSTGERICLAGDSAGGNLCITVSLRAAAYGVRVPDGIMVAYPVTTLQSSASPSRLLSLIDPLLPLSVLSKCVSAYSGKVHALRVWQLDACMPHMPPSLWVRTGPEKRDQLSLPHVFCRDRGRRPF